MDLCIALDTIIRPTSVKQQKAIWNPNLNLSLNVVLNLSLNLVLNLSLNLALNLKLKMISIVSSSDLDVEKKSLIIIDIKHSL